MAVRVTSSDIVKAEYPKLMVDSSDGEVCIFIDKKTATVVREAVPGTIKGMPVGHIRNNVDLSRYEIFTGSITLSNE